MYDNIDILEMKFKDVISFILSHCLSLESIYLKILSSIILPGSSDNV